MSGYVVDESGQIHAFWTDWDAAHSRPVFTTWQQIIPEPSLERSTEYLEARAAVGLPPLPHEDVYAQIDVPEGVTHVLPPPWFKKHPTGAAALMLITIALGVHQVIRLVRRKRP